MQEISILFTAPLDFDLDVMNKIAQLSAFTKQKEVKKKADLPDGTYNVWVCNPSANFVIDDSVLERYPGLEMLITPSTGTNHIDLVACRNRDIDVVSLLDDRPALEEISASSEFTFMLLLAGLKERQPRFELQGKTVGLVGYGRIGRRTHKYIAAMGGSVKVHDPYTEFHATIPLEQLFRECDAVVLCCTLTHETKGMVTEALLRSMKKNATMVNTSRGAVIDEAALLRVMRDRKDLRIMLDVIDGEERGTSQPDRLRTAGAIVTPHIAGDTFDSRTKAANIVYNFIQKAYHE